MEIRSLTGLRGIAAIIVLWFHTKVALISEGLTISIPTAIDRIFFSGGHSVDVFFVLSGFILAITYQHWFAESITTASYLKYFRRRVARVYPIHVVLLAVTVVAVLLAKSLNFSSTNGFDRFDFSTLPEHFLLIHAWGIWADDSGAWNPPSWSLSIEILAYFVLPIALVALARIKAGFSWVLLLLTCIIGFGLNLMTPWGDHGFAGIARGLSQFFLGCVIARFVNSKTAKVLQTSWGSWLSMVTLVAVCALIEDTGFIVGLSAATLLLALCGDNAVARFFACRPLYFLGEISYSLYIGHTLYSMVAWRLVKPEWMAASPLQLVVGFLFTNFFVIIISTATYYLIERPGRDLLADKGHQRKQVAT